MVDNDAVQKEMAAYQPIPEISSFLDENGNDTMEQQIQANYRQNQTGYCGTCRERANPHRE